MKLAPGHTGYPLRHRRARIVTATVSVMLLGLTAACSGTTAGTASVGAPPTAAVAPTTSTPAVAVVEVTRTVAPPAPVTSVVTTTAAPPPAPVIVTQTEVATVTAAGGEGGGTRRTVSGLVSPSGNITCGVVGGVLFCTIGVYDFDLPSCSDPGSGALISLASTGPSDISSCGAEILDGVDATTLDYGDVATLGSYVCTVEEVGMACVSPGGYGFTVARAGYQPF